MATNHRKCAPQVRRRRGARPNGGNTGVPPFDDAVAAAQQRLATLQRQAKRSSEGHDLVVAEVLHELQITLEELQVADEELRQQNEELAAAREVAEVERQRYQELFDFAPDAYLVTDTAAMVQQANYAAAALLAVPKDHLRGKPLILFVDPAEQAAFYERLTSLRQHAGASAWEMCVRPRQGQPCDVAVTAAIVRDAQGAPLALRWLLRDITAHKAAQQRAHQAEQAVHQSREQLRALATHLQTQQEEERRTIARQIHDELAQALTVLKIDVAWLSQRLAVSDASGHRRLRDMATVLDTLVNMVRRIGTELRPDILDDLGLTAAIEWQLQEVCKRAGMAYQLKLPAEEVPLGQAQATAIFRIFQEALTNVLRHANATQVTVHVEQQPDGLILQIADNGRGITTEQLTARHSLGLLGMRERAHLWGGEVTIEGNPGKGTVVSVHMPSMAPTVGILS